MVDNINLWSKTPATNASADAGINWAEGQAPSSVNDSARNMMTATANDRDDTRNQLTFGGGTTAYTLTTNSVNAAYQNGLMVSGKMPSAPTGAMTLSVDGVGAKKVFNSSLTQIGANGLFSGQFCNFIYNSALDTAAGAWVLMSNSPIAANTTQSVEVTVASVAGTTDILGAASNLIAISGTNTITSFGTGVNKLKAVRATGAFTITNNASIICPGGANITVAAGDTFMIESDASSVVRIISYNDASQFPKKATFSAHKNSVDQTGILTGTNTALTFGTEAFDVGGYFASNTWTPPPGIVTLSAAALCTANVVDQAAFTIAITKNGSLFKATTVTASGTGSMGNGVSCVDQANGTDAYTVQVNIAGAGNKTVNGSSVNTYFTGAML